MIYSGSTTLVAPANKFFNVTDDCQTQVTSVPITSIADMMNFIKAWYENEYGGSFIWGYNGTTLSIVFRPDTDPVNTLCGELEKISFGAIGLIDLILIRAIPCTTCEDITFNNCTEDELIFPEYFPGDVTYTIVDHQTGVEYTQYSASGTWDLSNTSGVFTPFSVYTLTITDESGQPVSWTDGENEYTCARITFVNSVNTNPVE